MKFLRKNYAVFRDLLIQDVLVIKDDFLSDLINIVTWPLSLVITFGYVLPSFGMAKGMGSFLLIGSLASNFFYLAISFASELVGDFEGPRCVEYRMLLPVSSYKIIWLEYVVMFALHSCALTVPLLPIGKIILGSRLDMSHFSIIKFVLIVALSGIFFGFFALLLASKIKSLRSFSSIWRRIYTPMQLIGCYWFSFAMAQKVFGLYAYIAFINPLTYMTEGVRSAVLGQEGFMNFWTSFGFLSLYTTIVAWYAMRTLKKRLDLL